MRSPQNNRSGADWRGYTVDVGDVNGDGRDDVIWNSVGSGYNITYVGLGNPDGSLTMRSPQNNRSGADWRGYTVDVGDVNGDGRDDVIWNSVGSGYNITYVGLGNPDGSLTMRSPQAHVVKGDWSRFVALTGDIDGDGRDDVIWNETSNAINRTYVGLARLDGSFAFLGAQDHPVGGGWAPVVAPAPGSTPQLPLPRSATTRQVLSKPHHSYPAVDIPVPVDTPVYAVQGGQVTAAGWMGNCGYGVRIRNGGVEWTYCHGNGDIKVPVGVNVRAGADIMRSGNTGRSTGPHLHVQVKIDGRLRCPQPALLAAWDSAPFDFRKMPTSGCSR